MYFQAPPAVNPAIVSQAPASTTLDSAAAGSLVDKSISLDNGFEEPSKDKDGNIISRASLEYVLSFRELDRQDAEQLARCFTVDQLVQVFEELQAEGFRPLEIAGLLSFNPDKVDSVHLSEWQQKMIIFEATYGRMQIPEPESFAEEAVGPEVEADEDPEETVSLEMQAENPEVSDLDMTQVDKLLRRYVTSGSVELRNEIATLMYPYCLSAAGRLAATLPPNCSIGTEHLVGSAMQGMLEAIERFSFSGGAKLVTFAALFVSGRMKDQLRIEDRVSRLLRSRADKHASYINAYFQKFGCWPSSADLATEFNLSKKDLSRLEEATRIVGEQRASKLGAAISNKRSNSSGRESSFGSLLEDRSSTDPAKTFLIRQALLEVLGQFSIMERLMLTLIMAKFPLRVIGDILDMSESRMSQLWSSSKDRLVESFPEMRQRSGQSDSGSRIGARLSEPSPANFNIFDEPTELSD